MRVRCLQIIHPGADVPVAEFDGIRVGGIYSVLEMVTYDIDCQIRVLGPGTPDPGLLWDPADFEGGGIRCTALARRGERVSADGRWRSRAQPRMAGWAGRHVKDSCMAAAAGVRRADWSVNVPSGRTDMIRKPKPLSVGTSTCSCGRPIRPEVRRAMGSGSPPATSGFPVSRCRYARPPPTGGGPLPLGGRRCAGGTMTSCGSGRPSCGIVTWRAVPAERCDARGRGVCQ